jgi:hypothetical protein
VVEFEEATRPAAMSILAHERALPSIAFPDGMPHLHRDVAVVACRATRATSWPIGRAELPLLALTDERLQGAIEHPRQITWWDPMAE